MKIKFLICIVLISSVCLSISCKKKKEGCNDPLSLSYNPEAEWYDGSCTYGGLGGNVTIVAKPQHHGMPIISTAAYPDSAFLKFNAVESPGTSPLGYNLMVEGDDGEDHVHIEGLKPGKYFIYLTGYDTADSIYVKGGIPVSITQTVGEIEVIVPVSE